MVSRKKVSGCAGVAVSVGRQLALRTLGLSRHSHAKELQSRHMQDNCLWQIAVDQTILDINSATNSFSVLVSSVLALNWWNFANQIC